MTSDKFNEVIKSVNLMLKEANEAFDKITDYYRNKERDMWKQLCKDIVTIMDKDPYYLRVGIDIWINKTVDHLDYKKQAEFYKLSDSIHKRLAKIKWD